MPASVGSGLWHKFRIQWRDVDGTRMTRIGFRDAAGAPQRRIAMRRPSPHLEEIRAGDCGRPRFTSRFFIIVLQSSTSTLPPNHNSNQIKQQRNYAV